MVQRYDDVGAGVLIWGLTQKELREKLGSPS